MKMESNFEFKKMLLKIACVCISMIIKIEDFDFDKNHTKMFWYIKFLRKHWFVQNQCVLGSIK